jgi:hypothetical protein
MGGIPNDSIATPRGVTPLGARYSSAAAIVRRRPSVGNVVSAARSATGAVERRLPLQRRATRPSLARVPVRVVMAAGARPRQRRDDRDAMLRRAPLETAQPDARGRDAGPRRSSARAEPPRDANADRHAVPLGKGSDMVGRVARQTPPNAPAQLRASGASPMMRVGMMAGKTILPARHPSAAAQR